MPPIHRLCLTLLAGVLACGRGNRGPAEPAPALHGAALASALRAPGGAAAPASRIPRRRALLVGIDHYSASSASSQAWPHAAGAPAQRLVPDLEGAVNDVKDMHDMLLTRYGFAEADVHVLIDRAATRAAVLDAIDRDLIAPAGAGDVIFFHWSGHGSQVANPHATVPSHM